MQAQAVPAQAQAQAQAHTHMQAQGPAAAAQTHLDLRRSNSSSAQSNQTSTNNSNSNQPPSAASSSTTSTNLSTNLNNASTLFGSTIPRTPRTPRTPRRPGTSSGPPPVSNAAAFFGSSGASTSAGDDFNFGFADGSPAAASGTTRSSGGLLLRKSPFGRKQSLGDFGPFRTLQQGGQDYQQQQQQQDQQKQSQSGRFLSLRRRANSSTDLRSREGIWAALGFGKSSPFGGSITDNNNNSNRAAPPTLPDYYAKPASDTNSAAAAADRSSISPRTRLSSGRQSRSSIAMDSAGPYGPPSGRMLTRTGTMPATAGGYSVTASGMMGMPPPSTMGMQGEAAMVHQHIQEMANKRISTLEYLRKAHEGRVYWFNTLLFDKPDLARMPYFDTRRLARRATNYLLLGLSLPAVIDLNSNTPAEFLRSLNLLLTEFDSFQSLHPESGGPASALTRARIPNLNVFRRATPSAKARRSSSATTNEILYEGGHEAITDGSNTTTTNASTASATTAAPNGGPTSSASSGGGGPVGNGLGGSASVVSFGQNEADLMPGEEYVHLLTPSLPFDPDFFETFATLCDVLIDAYTRLLGLLPTPRECTAAVAEAFTKADARVRKLIVQGVVKEFEDSSRNGVRTEVANVGKIVLGGLM